MSETTPSHSLDAVNSDLAVRPSARTLAADGNGRRHGASARSAFVQHVLAVTPFARPAPGPHSADKMCDRIHAMPYRGWHRCKTYLMHPEGRQRIRHQNCITSPCTSCRHRTTHCDFLTFDRESTCNHDDQQDRDRHWSHRDMHTTPPMNGFPKSKCVAFCGCNFDGRRAWNAGRLFGKRNSRLGSVQRRKSACTDYGPKTIHFL